MLNWIHKFSKKKCEHPYQYRNFLCQFDGETVGYFCRKCKKTFTVTKTLVMSGDDGSNKRKVIR